MSASPEIWRDFQAGENRVPLTGESRVRLYFSQLVRALDAVGRSLRRGTSTTSAESIALERFAARLRATFDALALKHFFPLEGTELRIDSTDSGFVHFSALLALQADLARRDAALAELPEVAELKRRMLEKIVDYGIHPRDLQVAMLRRVYLESLAADRLYAAFLPGELVKVGGADDAESFFWSFATYDRGLNRPFVYQLYFAYEGGATRLAEASGDLEEITAVARATASGRTSLLGFSNHFDERLPRLRPRIVKRLILGPYHSPIFTRTEGAFGALLDEHAERLPFALHWESETLISDRETRVGGGWLSKGQLRQVFYVPKNVDLTARGVSQVERSVLLPHWLAQRVRAEGLLGEHRHVVVDERNEVHGLD